MPIREISVNDDGCAVDDLAFCNAVQVTVGAQESWDEFVELAVQQEWLGVEALSGLPGTVAEVVTANPSVHGCAPGDTVASVRTWDQEEDRQRTFAWADGGFVPGGSRFTDGRYRLLDVAFLFRRGDLSAPVSDDALAARLGVEPGARVATAEVRAALLRP